MRGKRIKIGDVFELPLSNGLKAFGQYVFWDNQRGPLIQVFNVLSASTPPIEDIISSGPKFPPVFTGLQAAVKTGLWHVIGHAEVENFEYPPFRNGTPDSQGKVHVWYLYDGQGTRRVDKLPPGAEHYEVAIVWAQDLLAHRIETGENPFAAW